MKLTYSLIPLAITACLPITANAAKYTPVQVQEGGSITGKVSFSGKDPAPKIYNVAKYNKVCGEGDREIDFVKVNKGALNDVVVYLHKVKSGKAFSPGTGTGKLDQKTCTFDPFLQVMNNKETIEVINSDPVLHNIHTYELIGRAKKTVLNISQPEQGSINKTINLKRGAAMKLECDAHDFMHGFVFVAKNPYYAVVKANGSFKIDDVPAGKYTIKAWHGTLGEKKSKVDVAANGKATVNFAFKGR